MASAEMTSHCSDFGGGIAFQVRLPGKFVSEESDSDEINVEVASLVALASDWYIKSFTAQLGEL
jgi:hypothetical protein